MMPGDRVPKAEEFSSPVNALALFRRLFIDSGRAIFTAPMRWGALGWAAFSLVIITAFMGFLEKQQIHSLLAGNNRGAAEFIAGICRTYGDGGAVAVVTVSLLASGLATRKAVLLEAGIALMVAGLYCGAMTLMGQFILAEARPDRGGAMAFFAMGGLGVSGHASSAAVLFWPLLSVLGQGLKKFGKALFGAVLFGWAALVAWSRMWDNKHYLWNVFLGMAIGLSVGWAVVSEWKKLGAQNTQSESAE